MDIYCPRCGEPCDHDELHMQEVSYDEARRTFYNQSLGCGQLFDGRPCTLQASDQAMQARVLVDLLGDDVDGIAAMHEDLC